MNALYQSANYLV